MRSKKFNVLAVLAIFAFGAFAYLQQIPAQGWVSDDYVEVFDNGVTPYTNLSQTLKLCGNGHYTVARILGLPFKLYVGYWLGPVGSHYLQALLHIACALLFYRLLRLLDFALVTATLAAVIFVVAPWHSQAAIWWATMITPAGTLLILIAGCAYTRMLNRTLPPAVALPLICILTVASLCFYELWLFAPLLFVSIDLYVRFNRSSEPLTTAIARKSVSEALLRSWSIFAAVLVWAVAYKLTPVDQVREGHIVLGRVLPVLASIHFRSYAWVTRTPWRTALRDGAQNAGAWWLVLVVAIVSLAALLPRTDHTARPRRHGGQLTLRALLAWGFFLASRLVFVLMTGIGFNTRHNYGGALGLALLIASACEYLYTSPAIPKLVRQAGTSMVLFVLSVLAITSAGIRHHYVATSQAEQATLSILRPLAATWSPGDTAVIVAPLTDTQGELAYFSEQTGLWLERLLQSSAPGVHAYVVPSVKMEANDAVIMVKERADRNGILRLDFRSTHLFQWTAGQLREIQTEAMPHAPTTIPQ